MRSFAIITTTPNEVCAELHNRMPVVLKSRGAWLGEEPADALQLKAQACMNSGRGCSQKWGTQRLRSRGNQLFGEEGRATPKVLLHYRRRHPTAVVISVFGSSSTEVPVGSLRFALKVSVG